ASVCGIYPKGNFLRHKLVWLRAVKIAAAIRSPTTLKSLPVWSGVSCGRERAPTRPPPPRAPRAPPSPGPRRRGLGSRPRTRGSERPTRRRPPPSEPGRPCESCRGLRPCHGTQCSPLSFSRYAPLQDPHLGGVL